MTRRANWVFLAVLGCGAAPRATPASPDLVVRVDVGDDLLAVTERLSAAAANAGIVDGDFVIGQLDPNVSSRSLPLRLEWEGGSLVGRLINQADAEWSLRNDPRLRDTALLSWEGEGLQVSHPSDSSEREPFDDAPPPNGPEGALVFLPSNKGRAGDVLPRLARAPQAVLFVIWFLGE